MPAKKAAGKRNEPTDDVATEEQLGANYQRTCRALGLRPDPDLLKEITDEEREVPFTKVCLGDRELGPAGVRAIVEALLCRPLGGQRMMGFAAYEQLTAFRLWRCAAGDDGVIAVTDLLTARRLTPEGGSEVVMRRLVCLDLVANHIGPRGAEMLGRALATTPPALLTLNLGYNKELTQEGLRVLCDGLRANTMLKNLNLEYCDIDPEGAAHVGTLLATRASALAKLNLRGNLIEATGLARLGMGLRRNTALRTLDVSDNKIGGYPPSAESLRLLRTFTDCMLLNNTLTELELINNGLGLEGAAIVQPLVVPERTVLTKFTVDASLPPAVLDALVRLGVPKGKAKKKGGRRRRSDPHRVRGRAMGSVERERDRETEREKGGGGEEESCAARRDADRRFREASGQGVDLPSGLPTHPEKC